MNYNLPTSVDIAGKPYEIRSDFRAALDICAALTDAELGDRERAEAVLTIFYPDFALIPEEHYQEAIRQCFWFIRGGEPERDAKQPQLVNWEQDFNLICAPVSRIVGRDVRGMDYFHWWSWLAAYMEIGDCFFAQVVAIRAKKARGQKLDKQDKEFYRRNRDLVDLKTAYTEAEQAFIQSLTRKGG